MKTENAWKNMPIRNQSLISARAIKNLCLYAKQKENVQMKL